MEIIGYLNTIDTKGKTNIGGHDDLLFNAFSDFKEFTFEKDKYVITRDTHNNVNDSVMKYDKTHPSKESLDPDLFRLALEDTEMFYRPLHDSCKILQENEIEYVANTSPGFKYRSAGCVSKLHAMDRFDDEILSGWDRGHVDEIPPLWKQAAKVELLKKEKVFKGDLRGFTCPPMDYLFCCMRMNNDFNSKCHSMAPDFTNSVQRVGYVLQRGGFTHLLKRHHRDSCLCGEGDAVKWDSNLPEYLFMDVVLPVRFACWDKKGMSEEEWWKRQRWYYRNKVHSYILLPSGQIVLKHTGNPSGQDSTTDDNCIMHTFILCYAWRKLFGRSLYEDRIEARFDLYADDHIWSIPEKFKRFASFEVRKEIYALFGVELSREKDLVTSSPEGHTFLGPKAELQGHSFVPVYNREKIMCAALHMEHKYPLDVQIGRIISLMLNCAFDRYAFEHLRSYAFYLFDRCHKITLPDDVDMDLPLKWLETIPSISEVRAFWMGYEDKRPKTKGCRTPGFKII